MIAVGEVPDCLCVLTVMEYLELANDNLVELLEGIIHLGHLDNLSLAHNDCQTFPAGWSDRLG